MDRGDDPQYARRWRADLYAIAREVLPFLHARQLFLALALRADGRFQARFASSGELRALPGKPEAWEPAGVTADTPQIAILLAAVAALD